ncbi:MAG: pyridoxal-phosphate dependent enzyme [Gemmatimonadetes bacterium]|nr:pyridoxal-phosphate dependent enzyme [Gemmatimonadota bacterium]
MRLPTLHDLRRAESRVRAAFDPSPVRHYPQLDAVVGHGIRVLVKHENHLPTGSFKVRNGVASIGALDDAAAARGVIGASTGNHGQGLAWAGARRGVSVTICVPVGNNREKTASMRALGATVLEVGAHYNETIEACAEIAVREGRTLVHSTNHVEVIAGAATLTMEFLAQAPELDALVFALGGGSQVVGASLVRSSRAATDGANAGLRPALYAVGAAGAPAQHASWQAGAPVAPIAPRTFAEGIATGSSYALTFEAMRAAIADFVLATDEALADAVRVLWGATHNLAEGAGAAGLAGLRQLAPQLAGQTVGIVISGGNLDATRAATILAGGTPSP